jgi:Tol biopolymer transport system component
VPADGSASPRKLSAPLVAGGNAGICPSEEEPFSSFTPDGRRFVYLADQDQDEVFELYGARTDGGAPPVKLSAPLVAGGDVACFRISPDGARVVYEADQVRDGVEELFSVPVDASARPVQLDGPLAAGGNVGRWRISPDGMTVVYAADQEQDEVWELYAVAAEGGSAPRKLNPPLVRGGDVVLSDFEISADGARVVYRSDQERNERFELYGVTIDGGSAAVRLSPDMPSFGDVDAFEIAPDGRWVVFLADPDIDQVRELFGVPIDASAAPVALGVASPGGRHSFQIAPDGLQVVFRGAGGLFRTSILGDSMPRALGGPLVPGGAVASFRFAPDGSRVFYQADQDTDDVFELYGSALGPPHR